MSRVINLKFSNLFKKKCQLWLKMILLNLGLQIYNALYVSVIKNSLSVAPTFRWVF